MTPEMNEHFIPINKGELVQRLTSSEGLTAVDRQQFLDFCDALEFRLHLEFHSRLEQLKRSYGPFDPDIELENNADDARDELGVRADNMVLQLTRLLEQANFRRLARDEIENALQAASDWGLHLRMNFDLFDQLEVYVRGDHVGRRIRRSWKTWYRPEEIEVPAYRRLAVVFRLNERHETQDGLNARSIFLKLFKNVPKADIDMMLPGTSVRMSLVDQGKILFPTISGLGLTAFKVIQGTLMLVFSGIQGMLAFLIFLAGTMGYGAKSIFGYLNTKNKYQLSVTKSLYYQNLDSNAGVIHRIFDEAEEQEFRETVIAYYLLWRDAPIGGWSLDDFDAAIERKFESVFQTKLNFEIDDAVIKLQRLQLATVTPQGRWHPERIATATRRLRDSHQELLHPELHSPYFRPPQPVHDTQS